MSVLIGDFNANPFDPGIAAVYGLNATHIKEIAQRLIRAANGRSHRYFYNPMWRFLGVEPYGTYFNDELSIPVRFDWFVLDQVLVRPGLLPYFDRRETPDLQIVTSDGAADLSSFPRRDTSPLSDHLPLYFRFDWATEIKQNS